MKTAATISTIEELLEKEKEALDFFFQTVDCLAIEKFIEKLEAAKGLTILTGVGKSGIVAKKIAVTMTSTGSRALFLSSANALHGDIGVLHPEDLFVVLSKSGETEELIELLPFVKEKGVEVAAVVSTKESRLSKASDFTLVLPVLHEICPFNLAPTVSTVIQMIFGDIVAISLMQKRGFSLDDYAKNHPAGQIGKKVLLKVGDLMLQGGELPLARAGQKVFEVLVELSNKRCGCLLIIDAEGKLEGIFTDGDLRRALVKHGKEALDYTLNSLMTKTPSTISKEMLALFAIKKMEENRARPITVLPVLDKERRVLGLIRLHDILHN